LWFSSPTPLSMTSHVDFAHIPSYPPFPPSLHPSLPSLPQVLPHLRRPSH
jgi:hypothetical protein